MSVDVVTFAEMMAVLRVGAPGLARSLELGWSERRAPSR